MSNTVSLPGNVSLDGPRGRTYASILETVGSTPLVAAPKFAEAEGIKANLLFKCEFFNPLASVKDRIGLNMVLQLESDELKPLRLMLLKNFTSTITECSSRSRIY